MRKQHKLSPELQKLAVEVFEMAADFGLTHYPIKFVSVSPKELTGIAAYTGFPARMPHWTFGMEYEDLHKRYNYGVSKIYELVINTDPIIAYLLNTNALVEQKLVMIHVCGHADFFYNNAWFQHTDRQMLDQMANNASRVKRIMNLQGDTRVEDFVDICFSLENLVDPYLKHIKRRYPKKNEDEIDAVDRAIPKLKAKGYMDRYINPDDFIKFQKEKLKEKKRREKHFPEFPDRDILGFLVEHAPKLTRWQRDILAMVREEAYYFAPQRMTKVMNEGWATLIHSHFMTTKLANDSDIIDYCDSQSRAIAQGQSLNPYRLGLYLYKDIEDRWNKGRFGPEWERCEDMKKKKGWDLNLGKGKEKIFQVRKTHNDITFIDDFLTPEFCIEQNLFAFKPTPGGYTEISREFVKVKDQLLKMLSNGGSPVIQVIDGNFENRGELLLEHVYDGKELHKPKGQDTLKNLFKIWTRPVHIDTVEVDEDEGEAHVRWTYDGNEHRKVALN
jgi:stage V sporulation protein R